MQLPTRRWRGIGRRRGHGSVHRSDDARWWVPRDDRLVGDHLPEGTTWQRVLIHPGVYRLCSPRRDVLLHRVPGAAAPELLPGRRPLPPGTAADLAPHATTIVALAYADGVVMAGDRRATMGNLIASRDIEKVYPADAYSLVGIAGTAGVGIELIRLFQVELEHYEKIEGAMLSLDGKANRLATMIRGNLGAAMQGLAVVPLFAGFDLDAADPAKAGRIFSFDVAGGLYEEHGYDAHRLRLAVRQVGAEEAVPARARPPTRRSGSRSRRSTTPPTTTPPPAART